MIKILTIVGARPQFIKAAVISRAIRNSFNEFVNEVIVHTGQHYDENMSEIFFQQMDIPAPNYKLNIGGLGHGEMTGLMLIEIEKILIIEKPDWVLVYGDTNTTLAGALAAKKINIKIAHIEAGLRSFNMEMPEEVNRVIVDRISDLLFCPTTQSVLNLNNEGLNLGKAKIFNSGDIMYEAALYYQSKAKAPKIKIKKNFILATIHRASNTDDKIVLTSILKAINQISIKNQIVLPLHPRTEKFIKDYKIDLNKNIVISSPLGYFEMLFLIKNCMFIMTDSGGLQKESYFFKKPCVVLRNETEWIELVENGCNFIAGTNTEKIVEIAEKVDKSDYNFSPQFYGDGNTSGFVLNTIIKNATSVNDA